MISQKRIADKLSLGWPLNAAFAWTHPFLIRVDNHRSGN